MRLHPSSRISVPSEQKGRKPVQNEGSVPSWKSCGSDLLCITQGLFPLKAEQCMPSQQQWSAWGCWTGPPSCCRKGDRDHPEVLSRGRLQQRCLSKFSFPKQLWKHRGNAIFICIEILRRRKRNPFWPVAAQLSAPCRPGIKPWCDKNTGNRSLHSPPRDGKMLAGGYPRSFSIPVSSWGSNKRPRPWKTQQMRNAFTSVNFVNCFCFSGPEKYLSFCVEKLLTELWVAMDASFGLLQTLSLTVQDFILSALLGL